MVTKTKKWKAPKWKVFTNAEVNRWKREGGQMTKKTAKKRWW